MLTKRIRLLGLVALAIAAVALVACGDDNNDVTPTAPPANGTPTNGETPAPSDGLFDQDAAATFSLTMIDIDFDPHEFTISAGDVVEFDITNDGMLLHDFTIDDIDADVDVAGDADMPSFDADVHVELGPGDSGQMRLQVSEPGSYEFYCSVPGHREAGMVGTLTVE